LGLFKIWFEAASTMVGSCAHAEVGGANYPTVGFADHPWDTRDKLVGEQKLRNAKDFGITTHVQSQEQFLIQVEVILIRTRA
jgi:hypothetical protein